MIYIITVRKLWLTHKEQTTSESALSTITQVRRVKPSAVSLYFTGSCHKRQKPQAPTPQAPIRHRQTRKVANAKGLNRNTNHT